MGEPSEAPRGLLFISVFCIADDVPRSACEYYIVRKYLTPQCGGEGFAVWCDATSRWLTREAAKKCAKFFETCPYRALMKRFYR